MKATIDTAIYQCIEKIFKETDDSKLSEFKDKHDYRLGLLRANKILIDYLGEYNKKLEHERKS